MAANRGFLDVGTSASTHGEGKREKLQIRFCSSPQQHPTVGRFCVPGQKESGLLDLIEVSRANGNLWSTGLQWESQSGEACVWCCRNSSTLTSPALWVTVCSEWMNGDVAQYAAAFITDLDLFLFQSSWKQSRWQSGSALAQEHGTSTIWANRKLSVSV